MATRSFSFQWSEEDELGRGGEAVVFGGTFNGVPVAIKQSLLQLWANANVDREGQSHRRLHHKNVLKLLAIAENENFKQV